MNRAIFLDRDGTLIRDKGYICRFDEVEIFPFSIQALRMMNDCGFRVIVITNQSAIGRGICTEFQSRDIIAGFRSGCKSILVLSGNGPQTRQELEAKNMKPDLIAEDLLDAVEKIIRE